MNLPLVTVIGLTVAAVGVLMTVIGFSTAAWSTVTIGHNGYSTGLFTICVTQSSVTVCSSFDHPQLPDWFVATRAMVILGFLLGVACVVALTVYIVKRDLKILHLLGMGCAFAAGFCAMVGIIIYGAKRPTSVPLLSLSLHLGWSFALTVVGSVAFGIAGVIIVLDKLRGTSTTG